MTAEYRAKHLKQKVYVLDPFRRCASWVRRFYASLNFLMTLLKNEETIIENAGLIADALIIHNDNSKDPFWDNSARAVVEAIILHVATFPAYEGRRNLITVRQLLLAGVRVETQEGDIIGMDGLFIEMGANTSLDGFIAATAISMSQKNEKERSSVFSTAQAHTKFLDFPALRRVLQDNDFDLSDLKTTQGGVTVYLVLPTGRMNSCNRWLRLFINLALEAMENSLVHPKAKFSQTSTGFPIIFLLDEFASLGHLSQIKIAIGQIAGFGVKLWPILQDLSQLKAIYTSDWQSFIGNAGILQFFGNNDPETTEFISKRLGETSIIVQNKSQQSHQQKMQGSTGESFSIQTQLLLTGEEISRIFSRDDKYRRQLIIWAGRDPIILQRTRYFDKSLPEHKHFAGKYKDWS